MQFVETQKMKFVVFFLCVIASFPVTSADDVVSELSRRSGISVSELRELLADCSRHQLSMNICMFREFVAADMEMNAAYAKALARMPDRCRIIFKSEHDEWTRQRDTQCNNQADDETGGSGSMRPMIYSSCRATATKQRINVVKTIKNC